MKIAVIGAGYVGLITALVFAEHGHEVVTAEVDERRVDKLRKGEAPFYEPGLAELIERTKVRYVTTLADGVGPETDFVFVAVGSPPADDGSVDLSYVRKVAADLPHYLPSGAVVVLKSTVPPGTGDWMQAELDRSGGGRRWEVANNPEFLREGNALYDARHPNRIVLGADSEGALRRLEELYSSFDVPVISTTRRTAELIKYASNAFLATKISFINEMARLCHHLGADVTHVARGMGLDPRIGPDFLNAGVGFGGSCFPKDLLGLANLGRTSGQELPIVEAALLDNQKQRQWFFQLVETHLNDLTGRHIALLGLAFKPGTDDVREAPALDIGAWLVEAGAEVVAFDPVVTSVPELEARGLRVVTHLDEALSGADAVVMVTEWSQFRQLDWGMVARIMAGNLVFDGRNVLDARHLAQVGLQCVQVGKGTTRLGAAW